MGWTKSYGFSSHERFDSHFIPCHFICLQVSGGMMTHISGYLVALLCGEEVKRFNLFAIQVGTQYNDAVRRLQISGFHALQLLISSLHH